MNKAIEVRELTKRFGGFTAVDRVSFDVERGEVFGYLGANGAGKSTTIRMLCGLLEPSSGEARVAGHDVREDPEAVKSSIGYMSQKFSLYLDLPVAENLAFFGGAYGLSGRALRERIAVVLERVGMKSAGTEITGTLPGGHRQRLALACAILHAPEIVFLDEPTAGVDPVARRSFFGLIRDLAAEGTTVFVTTHYLDEAEHCRRIGLMVDGKLVALDTPKALKRAHVPEQVYSIRGDGLAKAIPALEAASEVITVEPFGATLHIRMTKGSGDASSIARAVANAGATRVSVEPIDATLEDVFLAVVAPCAPTEAP